MKYCSKLCIKRNYQIKKVKTSRFKNTEGYEKTATGKSVIWEKWAAEFLGAEWVNEEVMGNSYDLKLGRLKIDVKVSSYFVRKTKRGKIWNGGGVWGFKPNAFLKPEINYFLCICLKNDLPIKVLLIPSSIYQSKKGICIGEFSKYDKYNILTTL